MRYLTLNLKGVMQYYASTSGLAVSVSGGYYKTEHCPTKNALAGMIGCVMGIPRRDRRLKDLLNLKMKYRTLQRGCVIRDFQTVSGMPIKDKPGEFEKFVKIKGGEEEFTIIKTVEYLCDYAFEAYIGSEDEDLLKKIREAFWDPVWDPYLGRKNCLPSIPIVTDGKILTEEEMEEMEDVYDCLESNC
ncbi:MAG: type I-E CRISPR-associated protein Cas5/CasD [Lachnospiraceae bacterium]|nr:type I-E CRISPR-associated protein Cas5/CasD [Lachnospiraceae bacterium]MBR3735937.1 type I-E CRISPR-associated protein Cas5/CasD [Lachnospiraceae bacterium]MBR6157044.1 type I-E CRISPR-associated protein Cas5/CasD [Lachnospiraceae bacterium]